MVFSYKFLWIWVEGKIRKNLVREKKCRRRVQTGVSNGVWSSLILSLISRCVSSSSSSCKRACPTEFDPLWFPAVFSFQFHLPLQLLIHIHLFSHQHILSNLVPRSTPFPIMPPLIWREWVASQPDGFCSTALHGRHPQLWQPVGIRTPLIIGRVAASLFHAAMRSSRIAHWQVSHYLAQQNATNSSLPHLY